MDGEEQHLDLPLAANAGIVPVWDLTIGATVREHQT
jgi:hypothetical protein